MRNTERRAELPHLDLVEVREGLNDAPGGDHLLDERDPVVVSLDDPRAACAPGLDRVRVDRTLSEQVVVDSQPGGFSLEYPDEGLADPMAFGFGGDLTAQGAEEVVRSVDEVEVFAEADLVEHADHVLALVFSHQTVVDMEELEALWWQDETEELGRDRGVHPAGCEQKNRPVPDGFAEPIEEGFHHVVGAPGRSTTADLSHEVCDHAIAVDGVVHLRVKLKSVPFEFVRPDGGVAVSSRSFGGS